MNTQISSQEKPNLVTVVAVMTLVSGIVNLFWGLIATGAVMVTLVGIICIPLTILPTMLGVFELIYAAKLLSNPPQPVQPSISIAILEIACILAGNVFSMVVGVLALVFYNDLAVKDYFARLNRTSTPGQNVEPVTPPAPASFPKPEVEPVIPEPATAPPEESPAPENPKTPRGRKVA